MYIIEITLCLLVISQFINFYMILKMNTKMTNLIEKINRHQELLENLINNIDKSLTTSNKYLHVIAEKHGYR
jgi:fatty acid-binding protein DegV